VRALRQSLAPPLPAAAAAWMTPQRLGGGGGAAAAFDQPGRRSAPLSALRAPPAPDSARRSGGY
jgi:hypothetical protein